VPRQQLRGPPAAQAAALQEYVGHVAAVLSVTPLGNGPADLCVFVR
jgi:hypothetical protein